MHQFLALVASKTSDPAHRRILKAAEKKDVGAAIEAELSQIIEETLHEA